MTEYDYGPLDTYEVIWKSGHVERVQAHQVMWPRAIDLFSEGRPKREHVMIHGKIDGRWKLVLSALPEDIVTIRLVTADESVPNGGDSA